MSTVAKWNCGIPTPANARQLSNQSSTRQLYFRWRIQIIMGCPTRWHVRRAGRRIVRSVLPHGGNGRSARLDASQLTLRAEFTQTGEDDFLQVDERHDAADHSSQCEEASPKEIGGKSSRLTWIHCIHLSPGNRTKSGRQKFRKMRPTM